MVFQTIGMPLTVTSRKNVIAIIMDCELVHMHNFYHNGDIDNFLCPKHQDIVITIETFM